MELSAKTAKISTSSDSTHWATSFSENGLFILLEIETDKENHAASRGKEILDLLLIRSTNISKANLDAVSLLLGQIKDIKHVKTAIIGLLKGQALYLASKGEAVVEIKRGGKIGKILSSDEIVSGEIHERDLLIFHSDKFNQIVSKEKKQQIFTLSDLQSIEEALAPHLLESEKLNGVAVLVISIGQQKQVNRWSEIGTNFRQEAVGKLTSLKEKSELIFKGKAERIIETPEKQKSRKTFLTISIILVILLVTSIFFNLNHSRRTTKQQKLTEILTLISAQYEEAVSLVDLNPVRARTLLSDSKLSLASVLIDFSKNSKEYKEINEWLNKIASAEVDAYKIFKFTSVPVFFDLTIIKPDGAGSKIAAYRHMKAILDSKNKVVYKLLTDSKQAAVLAGSETVKDANSIAVHSNNVYLVNSDGIVNIDITTNAAKEIIKGDEKWGQINSIESFGGNLYLLDSKNNAIWKYIATDTGFSGISNYLASDVRVDFSNSKKIVIDGSVWVTDRSNLFKFNAGAGEPFVFKGFSDAIANIDGLSTSDVDKNLYVLDKTISRIIVFDKDGLYQSQYQWDELKNSSDFIASEEEKKIFVMIGNKIYGIDLK